MQLQPVLQSACAVQVELQVVHYARRPISIVLQTRHTFERTKAKRCTLGSGSGREEHIHSHQH